MRVNPWTLGLAAVGLVSLPAALQAEEKLSPLLTAVTPTTISGAVSTSIQWAPGTGDAFTSPRLYQRDLRKSDGFNLDVVSLTLDKPADEANWAAGYHVDLWMGPDANAFASQSSLSSLGGTDPADFAIKQAYVALRTPPGNGLYFKVGVFDSIIGYESHDSYKDPNYTRSYATSLEPHTHTGVLLSYQFTSLFSASVGVANTHGPIINERANPPRAESYKSYMGSIALTAPDDWGFISGSTLFAGIVSGYNSSLEGSVFNFYSGAVFNTPVEGLRFGAAYDYVRRTTENPESRAWAVTLYSSWEFAAKWSLHLRGEYAETDAGVPGTEGPFGTGSNLPNGNSKLFGVTTTLQYDLWKNVISRLEFIWDHQAGDNDMNGFGGQLRNGDTSGSQRNRYTLALNLIYRF